MPHYTPKITKQTILSDFLNSKGSLRKYHIAKTLFFRRCNCSKQLHFMLGVEIRFDVPIFEFDGYQQWGQFSSQLKLDEVFYSQTITNANCTLGPENCIDAGLIIECIKRKYYQVFGESLPTSRRSTKNNIPRITKHKKFSVLLGHEVCTFLMFGTEKNMPVHSQSKRKKST